MFETGMQESFVRSSWSNKHDIHPLPCQKRVHQFKICDRTYPQMNFSIMRAQCNASKNSFRSRECLNAVSLYVVFPEVVSTKARRRPRSISLPQATTPRQSIRPLTGSTWSRRDSQWLGQDHRPHLLHFIFPSDVRDDARAPNETCSPVDCNCGFNDSFFSFGSFGFSIAL